MTLNDRDARRKALRDAAKSGRTTLPFGLCGIRTSGTFMQGVRDGMPSMPLLRKRYLAMAKRAGVSLSGKCYDPQLASYPGDPTAWVGSPDDVKRVCQHKGLGCTGDVNVPLPDDPKTHEKIKPHLAPDIVEREVVQVEREAGEPILGREREDLKEKIIARHCPKPVESYPTCP